MNNEGPFFVKIYVHAVRRDDGSGGQTDADVIASINQMRQPFKPHNIFFVWDCTVLDFESTSWYNTTSNSNLPISEIVCDAIESDNYNDDGIDIYFFPDDADGTAAGDYGGGGAAMSFGNGSAMYLYGRSNIATDESPDMSNYIPIRETLVTAHEMGHCLGLYHPHEISPGDCLDNPPFEDNLIGTVNLNCEYIGSTNGTPPGESDIYNIMTYSNRECIQNFTPEQGQRMRNMMTYVDEEYIDFDFLIRQRDHVVSYKVESDTEWTEDRDIHGTLEVMSGVTLTIPAGVTGRFSELAKIRIYPGARLILHGTLTNVNHCGNQFWQGVEVWGNSDLSQYPVNGEYGQGRIDCRPGSVIENAVTGVQLYGDDIHTTAGGMITARGATFRNNSIAVEFAPYENLYPYTWYEPWYLQPRPYRGTFTQCNFINNNGNFMEQTFRSFILMDGVNGVRIAACDFSNTETPDVTNTITNYGYGIEAYDSGFNVKSHCLSNTYPCSSFDYGSFSGLGVGIFNASMSGESLPYRVTNMSFNNCFVGMEVSSVSNGTILFNNFNLGSVPNSSVSSTQTGICLDGRMAGFTIQENYFTGSAGNASARVGILSRDLGDHNQAIRRNYFSGLTHANAAIGANAETNIEGLSHGLHYLCNENTNNEFDIINGSLFGNDRIRYAQGLSMSVDGTNEITYLSAGNTFTSPSFVDKNLSNTGQQFEYFYLDGVTNQFPAETSGDIVLTPTLSENTCPEVYCDPPCRTSTELAQDKSKYYDDRSKENQAKADKNNAEAAGQTEAAKAFAEKAEYHHQEMDKEAFMVVLHLMIDTLNYEPDSIATWIANLDNFGMDMFWALNSQTNGDFDLAETFFSYAADRTDLSPEQRNDLVAMRSLMGLLKAKKPSFLNERELEKLEKNLSDETGITGNIARNILRRHGYDYPLEYTLPRSAKKAEPVDTELLAAKEFSLAPNPSNGQFSVTWTPKDNAVSESAVLTVFNALGQQVKNVSLAAEVTHNMDLTNSENGVYFYRLETAEGVITAGKLVKN